MLYGIIITIVAWLICQRVTLVPCVKDMGSEMDVTEASFYPVFCIVSWYVMLKKIAGENGCHVGEM